jgi:hypothetical protein
VTGAGVGESVGFSVGGTVIGRVAGRRVLCSWLLFAALVVVVQAKPAVAVLVATGGLGEPLPRFCQRQSFLSRDHPALQFGNPTAKSEW